MHFLKVRLDRTRNLSKGQIHYGNKIKATHNHFDCKLNRVNEIISILKKAVKDDSPSLNDKNSVLTIDVNDSPFCYSANADPTEVILVEALFTNIVLIPNRDDWNPNTVIPLEFLDIYIYERL